MKPTTPNKPDDLLLPSEAARIIGVSPDSVRGYAASGKLPCMRTVSGRRLFRRSDVDALVVQRALSPRGRIPVTDVSKG